MRDPYLAFMPYPDAPVAHAPNGPLAGLRFGVKDLFDVEGYPTGCGNPLKLAQNGIAAGTAPAVAALLDAGAAFAGKTQTDEIAWAMVGLNPYFGGTVNPAAPDRITGGSSCGSAAAVAGGLVDFALGTDTGGSVRAPAAFCGVWGFRPTWGAISMECCMPLAPSFDSCGIFAREGAVLARVAEVMLGPDVSPIDGSGVKAATDMFARVEAGAMEALQPSISTVSDGEIGLYVQDAEVFHDCFDTLQSREVVATQGPWIEADRPPLGPMVAGRYAAARKVPAEAERAALATWDRLVAALAARLEGRAVLAPAMQDVPPLRVSNQATLTAFAAQARRLLAVAGVGRLPQVVFPAARWGGGPLALSLIGPAGSDLSLIRLACEISGALRPVMVGAGR